MRFKRATLMIVAASMLMENIDSTAIATALPAIAADLNTSPITLKLAITSYLLAFAVFIPASGWMADRFGARPVFTAALVTFITGSIGCAFSTTLNQIVMARIVEGMGAAMMTPVSRVVMLRTVDKKDLVNAMMWVTIPGTIGPMIGPAVGGFITTYWSWHGIFLINIPIGLLGIVLAQIVIPPFDIGRRAFDFKGFFLSGFGLAGLVFGFSVAGFKLLPFSVVAAILICGTISMTLYVIHAKRVPNPVLDLSLAKLQTMRVILTGGILFRVGVGAMPFLLPLLFQVGFGMTPFQSGLLTLSAALGALVMKPLTAFLLKRYGFRQILIVNGTISAFSLGIGALFTPSTPYLVILAILLVSGIFRSLQFTSLNTIAYAEVDSARMSGASTLVSVTQQLSMCLGVAVGAFCVEMTVAYSGTQILDASSFAPAFIVITLIALTSVIPFYRLPRDAGHQIAGPRTIKAKDVEPRHTPPSTEEPPRKRANN